MKRLIQIICEFFRPLWPKPTLTPGADPQPSPPNHWRGWTDSAGPHPNSSGWRGPHHPSKWTDDFGRRVLNPETVDEPTPDHAKSVERAIQYAAAELYDNGTLKRLPATYMLHAGPFLIQELLRSGLWLMRAPETPEPKESEE